MPVYLFTSNLIIKKASIAAKYPTGIDGFKEYLKKHHPESFDEDTEIFVLYAYNTDDFDIDELTGLDWKQDQQHSEDFVIVERYTQKLKLWKADWLEATQVFAWHIDCAPELIAKAERIENMPVSEIMQLQQAGKNPLKAIL